MICPLLAHKTYIEDDYPMQVYEDCLKEECAWWDDGDECCMVFLIGAKLCSISMELKLLLDKMPYPPAPKH